MRILQTPGLAQTLERAGHGAAFARLLSALRRGDFRAAQARKLKGAGAGAGFWRARLDDTDRLLFTFVRAGEARALALLEFIEQHAYERSRLLRGAGFDAEALQQVRLQEDEDQDTPPQVPGIGEAFTLPALSRESDTLFWQGKPLSLDAAQHRLLHAPLPLLVAGGAGCGKSALALERLRSESGERLYLTHSPALARQMQALFETAPCATENRAPHFWALQVLLQAGATPAQRAAGYGNFRRWVQALQQGGERLLRGLDLGACFEEFEGVIGAAIAGDLTLAQYQQLGRRQSLFAASERARIFELFQRYRAWLAAQSLLPLSHWARQARAHCVPRFDFVLIDEVQDFTPAELALGLAQLRNPAHFVLLGDAHQVIHPNFFSWARVKSLFWNPAAGALPVQRLQGNYRNASSIAALAARLLQLRERLLGSIDRESFAEIPAPHSNNASAANLVKPARPLKRAKPTMAELEAQNASHYQQRKQHLLALPVIAAPSFPNRQAAQAGYATSLGLVTASDATQIRMTHSALRKMRSHSARAEMLSVIGSAQALLAGSVELWSEVEDQPEQNSDIAAVRYYGARAQIGGADCFVRFVVNETSQGRLLHDGDAETISPSSSSNRVRVPNAGVKGESPKGYARSIGRWLAQGRADALGAAVRAGAAVRYWPMDSAALAMLESESAASAQCAVIVPSEEDKERARALLSTPLLFCVAEAKGLEYERIILLGFCAEPGYADLANDPQAQSGAAARYHRLTRSAEDAQSGWRAFLINRLYTAITRARSQLDWVEADRTHPLLQILLTDAAPALPNVARSFAPSSAPDAVTISSHEEWLQEAQRLQEQGLGEQAERIRARFPAPATPEPQTPAVPWEIADAAWLRRALEKIFIEKTAGRRLREQCAQYCQRFGFPTQALGAEPSGDSGRDSLAKARADCRSFGIEHRDRCNCTPLMRAALLGEPLWAQELLSQGARLDARESLGRNALRLALPRYGTRDWVRRLALPLQWQWHSHSGIMEPHWVAGEGDGGGGSNEDAGNYAALQSWLAAPFAQALPQTLRRAMPPLWLQTFTLPGGECLLPHADILLRESEHEPWRCWAEFLELPTHALLSAQCHAILRTWLGASNHAANQNLLQSLPTLPTLPATSYPPESSLSAKETSMKPTAPSTTQKTIQVNYRGESGSDIPQWVNGVRLHQTPEGAFLDLGFIEPWLVTALQHQLSRGEATPDAIDAKLIGRFALGPDTLRTLHQQIGTLLTAGESNKG